MLYLKYGCSLEINNARTAAYVAQRCEICPDNTGVSSQVLNNCDILNWELDPADGVTIQPASFTTPAVDGPWYDSGQPASGQFLGFFIDKVSKPAHIKRGVTTKLVGSGGGILETLRPQAQILEFEVYLFACNSAAMEYGMRYLMSSLVGGGCDEPCSLCDLEYRDSCVDFSGTPTNAEFDTGRWTLQNVGVVSSPEWMSEPVNGAGYKIRKAKFTLASEKPWKYQCPETCLDAGTFATDALDPCGMSFDKYFGCSPTAASCAITEPSLIGETGLVVELTAGDRKLSGVEIRIIPDEYGWVCDPGSAPPGFVDPDPCDVVQLNDLPPGYTLVYDTSIERVSVVTNAGVEMDGVPFLTFDGSPPTFPVVRCGQFCAKVFVDECAVDANTEVTIRSVHREL